MNLFRSNKTTKNKSCGHKNCSHGNHQNQIQSQKMMDSSQQTVQCQIFANQAVTTVDTTVRTARMCKAKRFDDETLNELQDGVIDSLNFWSSASQIYHKEGNKDALDLGRKRLADKIQTVKDEKPEIYELLVNHFKVMEAALDGHNTYYDEERVPDKKGKDLMDMESETICDAYSYHAKIGYKFRKQKDEMIANHDQIRHEQAEELHAFRKIDKNKQQKKGSFKKPRIADLYFTESGKKAKFVNMKTENDQKEMENVLMGNLEDDLYDKLPQNTRNAAIWWDTDKFKGWFCCQVIPRNKLEKDEQKKVLDYILVQLAVPKNGRRKKVDHPSKLEVDPVKVKKLEALHIKKYKSLGYPAIGQDHVEFMDTD